MTPEQIAKAFLQQHPNAPSLNYPELEGEISQWVVGSYINATSGISARRALGMPQKDAEKQIADALSRYLGSVKPIMDYIRPADSQDTTTSPDASQMSFSEYRTWRQQQHVGGKGLFD